MIENQSRDEDKSIEVLSSRRDTNPDIVSESARQHLTPHTGYGSPLDDIVLALKAMKTDNDEKKSQDQKESEKQYQTKEPEPKVEEKISREKLVEEYERLKSDFEKDLKAKEEQLEKLKDEIRPKSGGNDQEKDEQALNLETLVSYLNDNKTILMEKMQEDERKRVESVLTLSKDVKSMCKEAIDALKVDLMGFYNLGKTTFTTAISEIGKVTPLSDSKNK